MTVAADISYLETSKGIPPHRYRKNDLCSLPQNIACKNRWDNSFGLCCISHKDCYYTMLSFTLKWVKLPTKVRARQRSNPIVLQGIVISLSFTHFCKEFLLMSQGKRCYSLHRASTSFVMGTRTCKHSMTHVCGIWSLLQISMDSQAAAATVLLCSLFPEKRRVACSHHHRSFQSPGSFSLHYHHVVIHRVFYSQLSVSLHTNANETILSLGFHPRFPTCCLASAFQLSLL